MGFMTRILVLVTVPSAAFILAGAASAYDDANTRFAPSPFAKNDLPLNENAGTGGHCALEARIVALEAEIARLKNAMAEKSAARKTEIRDISYYAGKLFPPGRRDAAAAFAEEAIGRLLAMADDLKKRYFGNARP